MKRGLPFEVRADGCTILDDDVIAELDAAQAATPPDLAAELGAELEHIARTLHPRSHQVRNARAELRRLDRCRREAA